jgi:hypothetical protein
LETVEFAHQPLAAAGQRRIAQVAAVPEVGADVEIRAAAQVKLTVADTDKFIRAGRFGDQRTRGTAAPARWLAEISAGKIGFDGEAGA